MSALLVQLRQHAQRLGNSRFVRNVAAVGTGIAAAQAISIAFMPFLTRLYGPEAFGALAAFTAVVNIITPLATLGYANAIVMPETEEGATAVARLSLICAAIVAPLSLGFVSIFQPKLAEWTGLEATPGFLYLIPISLFLSALLSVANQVAIREGLFKAKSSSHVASTVVMNTAKLAGGLLVPSGLALILISMVGKAVNYLMLLARVPRRGTFEVRRWFGVAGVREAAKEQQSFAIFRMPQAVIYSISFSLPVLMLTSLFGAAEAGQYSITLIVISAPVMLIGQSVGEVFYPKITRAIQGRAPNASELVWKSTGVLLLLASIPFGTTMLFADQLFPYVFGVEWGRAGEYAQWVSIWMVLVLATRPALAAIPALRMQGMLLAYEVLITGTRVLALYAGFRVGDDLTAVVFFVLSNVLGYLLLLALVFRRLRRWALQAQ